ncbi:MAG: hypothetical protein ACYCZX_06290 [Rhodospirillaceae bacterium]
MRILTSGLFLLILSAGMAGGPGIAAQSPSIDASDPIAVLNARLEKGADHLAFEAGGFGYLRDLLAHLHVNADSQMLVFSKTSLQYELISPAAPRAIYFNDGIAIGYVQNAPVMEVMVPTATRGYVFYTLDNIGPAPKFTQHQGAACGRCHGGANPFAPGMLVASTPVTPDGTPVFVPSEGPPKVFNATDQRTPFRERWGGWYVTGLHGDQTHQGNGATFYREDGTVLSKTPGAQNVVSLETFVSSGKYLAPGSDIVAIMTFEHQATMTNLLLAAGEAARPDSRLSETAVDDLLAYMLFAEEAPLPALVRGTSTFTQRFPQLGPRDAKGRSLRDFDLETRLFKYPMSYMVYSASFDAVPAGAKAQIYARLADILTGKEIPPRFAGLSPDDRRAIFEILRDTKSDLPKSWR